MKSMICGKKRENPEVDPAESIVRPYHSLLPSVLKSWASPLRGVGKEPTSKSAVLRICPPPFMLVLQTLSSIQVMPLQPVFIPLAPVVGLG